MSYQAEPGMARMPLGLPQGIVTFVLGLCTSLILG